MEYRIALRRKAGNDGDGEARRDARTDEIESEKSLLAIAADSDAAQAWPAGDEGKPQHGPLGYLIGD